MKAKSESASAQSCLFVMTRAKRKFTILSLLSCGCFVLCFMRSVSGNAAVVVMVSAAMVLASFISLQTTQEEESDG
eukprot:scaffold10892_cov163-Amphora_coffeaeformis.AAC.4